MKVAEYHSNSDIRLIEVKKPSINKEEILVQMAACGICGTDVMEWYRSKKAPRILGHEMTGTIVKIGSKVKDFNIGDRVFVSHHVPCFDCYYCDNNKHSACNNLHKGNFHPGGFSEFIRIPKENILFGTFILPEEMTFSEGAMIEPMACAVAGQKMMDIGGNESTLVIGAGISGLTHIQLLRGKDSTIVATDISEYRLAKAKEFGADHIFHMKEGNKIESTDR